MLKKLACTISIFALFIFTACDSGLRVVEIYVSKYPERIAYFSGQDNEIDLSGLEITLKTAEGTEQAVPYSDSEFDMRFTVTHTVDFNTAGVYTVYIESIGLTCQFPVEVIA